jgi:phage tail-like protein
MSLPFPTTPTRANPYPTFAFALYFGQSTTPVAGVSKVSSLKRSSDPIEYKEGGNPIILQGLGRTKYEPVTCERGLTHDTDFEQWANAAQVLDNGHPVQSLANLRRTLIIVLRNEQGQPVHRWKLYKCWVSEYQAIPDLDAGTNAVAIEHIKLVHEGWEHDLSLTEPNEAQST